MPSSGNVRVPSVGFGVSLKGFMFYFAANKKSEPRLDLDRLNPISDRPHGTYHPHQKLYPHTTDTCPNISTLKTVIDRQTGLLPQAATAASTTKTWDHVQLEPASLVSSPGAASSEPPALSVGGSASDTSSHSASSHSTRTLYCTVPRRHG